MVDTETYTIESPDGDTDDLDLPEGLVDALSEPGDTRPSVVADIAMYAFAQQAHALAHHSQGDAPDDIGDLADDAEVLFEERFGVSFAEATGHGH